MTKSCNINVTNSVYSSMPRAFWKRVTGKGVEINNDEGFWAFTFMKIKQGKMPRGKNLFQKMCNSVIDFQPLSSTVCIFELGRKGQL